MKKRVFTIDRTIAYFDENSGIHPDMFGFKMVADPAGEIWIRLDMIEAYRIELSTQQKLMKLAEAHGCVARKSKNTLGIDIVVEFCEFQGNHREHGFEVIENIKSMRFLKEMLGY